MKWGIIVKVRITGKVRRRGISKKTGNNYDFIELHYTGPRRGVIGEAAITKTIDPGLYDFDNLAVPGDYIIECDDTGEIISLAPVSPATNTKN